MKKIKRFFAILIVVVLLALYCSTLVLAIIGSEQALALLRAAIYATVVLPALLWAYTFVYKLLSEHYKKETPDQETDNEE